MRRTIKQTITTFNLVADNYYASVTFFHSHGQFEMKIGREGEGVVDQRMGSAEKFDLVAAKKLLLAALRHQDALEKEKNKKA